MAWKLDKEQFITNYPFLSLVSYFGWLLLVNSWQHSCNNHLPKSKTNMGKEWGAAGQHSRINPRLTVSRLRIRIGFQDRSLMLWLPHPCRLSVLSTFGERQVACGQPTIQVFVWGSVLALAWRSASLNTYSFTVSLSPLDWLRSQQLVNQHLNVGQLEI